MKNRLFFHIWQQKFSCVNKRVDRGIKKKKNNKESDIRKKENSMRKNKI